MTHPSRDEIITRAVALLRTGLLPRALPVRLMAEFGLSREYAHEVGLAAMKRWRAEKPPRPMSNHPPDSQIVTRAVELLQGGVLPSDLPQKLMEEFGISADHAEDLVAAALKRRRKQTKPIGGLGE